MKTWVLRFRAVDKRNFDALCDGRKAVETRAATKRYRGIQAGDQVKVTCGKESVKKEVVAVEIFPSIEAMAEAIPFKNIMPYAETLDEVRNEYYGYPGYKEKIAEYGLVALTLR